MFPQGAAPPGKLHLNPIQVERFTDVTGNSFGAVALVLPGVLEKAADRFQSDFYVLPRSMADVLLLPIKDGNDPGPRCMKEIMAASNEMTENAPILSDNVYRYVRGDGLMIV